MSNDKRSIVTPGIGGVSAFTITYLVLAVVGAIAGGNAEFLMYIAVMLLIIAGVGFVHYRVRLSLPALWCLSVWGIAHMAGGLVPVPEGWPINGEIRVLYSLWLVPDYLKYDHIVHAFGFGVTAWICWQGIQSAMSKSMSVQPTFGLMVLCATAGMGFGALNEVVEFAATLLVPETNVGGYINTGWDMVANFSGTTIAVSLIWFSGRRSNPAEL